MFRKTQDYQISFDDRLVFADAQTKTAVDSSRAKLVGDIIFPNVDEDKFSALFSEKGSRPNISIKQYVSALVLKRMYRMSDEVLIEFLRCGSLNFQYALHTTQDEKQPLSESSLRRFRRRIEAYNEENGCDLIKDEFERISRKMAVDMGVLHTDRNTGEDDEKVILVRMDSMEIECHAKAMSRLEILYTTNVIVLRYLLKKGFKDIIPDSLSHYFEDGDRNRVTYHRSKEAKNTDTPDTRIDETIAEMLLIQTTMEETFAQALLSKIPEYEVFQRVLEEQTKKDENGNTVAKDNGEISPDSVQNPFDTTATYRFKRGQHHGYVMNVAEAIDGKGNGIITHASVEANTCADSSMAEQYMEEQPDNGPKQVFTADGAYNSEHLEELAAQKNIDIQTTSLTGAEPYDIDADFVLNEEGTEILSCPCGKVPVENKYSEKTGYITATMPENCCRDCPHKDDCNVHSNKKNTVSKVKLTKKMVKRAEQARSFTTEEGKANARRRNGVEGIMSVMRRKYDIDHLPVFGIDRVKNWIWTTLLSYNLVKYQKYQNASQKELTA